MKKTTLALLVGLLGANPTITQAQPKPDTVNISIHKKTNNKTDKKLNKIIQASIDRTQQFYEDQANVYLKRKNTNDVFFCIQW